VGLDHGEADLVLELRDARLGGLKQLAQLGILAVLREQLARAGGVVGRLPVLPREGVRRLERAVGAPDLRVALAIADHGGARRLAGELVETALDLLYELLDHAIEVNAVKR